MEFWDKKINKEEMGSILEDERNPKFVEIASLLLSRNNNIKEVFSDYLNKVIFCRNWQKIKRRMRKNNWNDERIIFWDEVYKTIVKTTDRETLKTYKARSESEDSEIKQIGIAIRETRQRMGLTQFELAEKTKVSQQTISLVENGRVNISLLTLDKIIKALNLKITLIDKSRVTSNIQAYTSSSSSMF